MPIKPKFWTVPFEGDHLTPYVDAASRLLSASLGYDAVVVPSEMFADRWGPKRNVVRCRVDSAASEAPETIILRQTRNPDKYDPLDTRLWGPTYQLFDYWAAASFLSTATPQQSPRFHGGHREGGIILVGDVGNNMSVVNALAGDDPIEAKRELMDLARCIGTVHAKSLDKEPRYLEIRNALCHNKEQVSFRDANYIKINLDGLRQTVASLDLEISSGAERDIQTVIESLESPGEFLAFIHRDPIPPNFMRADSELIMIDLEFSGYGHALTDVMSFRMGFPTYGLPARLPSHVIQAFEANYRSVFAEGCEAANLDDVYYPAAVEACAWWLIFELIRNLEKTSTEETPEDQRNNLSERRKWIITRLAAFVEISSTAARLPGLGALCQALYDRLTRLWGSEAVQLDYYPAFSNSQMQ